MRAGHRLRQAATRGSPSRTQEGDLELEAALLLSAASLAAIAVLHRSLASPVTGLDLELRVDPGVVHGPLGVSLRQAQRLHGLVLAIALTALDGDVLGLEVFLALKDQPALLVPDGDALVHAVVPGLQTLDGALRRAAKHGGKVLLDALPLELLVVPRVDDEVALFRCVLLVDVTVLAVLGRRGRVAVVGVCGHHHTVLLLTVDVRGRRVAGVLTSSSGRSVAASSRQGRKLNGRQRCRAGKARQRRRRCPGTTAAVGAGDGLDALIKLFQAGKADQRVRR